MTLAGILGGKCGNGGWPTNRTKGTNKPTFADKTDGAAGTPGKINHGTPKTRKGTDGRRGAWGTRRTNSGIHLRQGFPRVQVVNRPDPLRPVRHSLSGDGALRDCCLSASPVRGEINVASAAPLNFQAPSERHRVAGHATYVAPTELGE